MVQNNNIKKTFVLKKRRKKNKLAVFTSREKEYLVIDYAKYFG